MSFSEREGSDRPATPAFPAAALPAAGLLLTGALVAAWLLSTAATAAGSAAAEQIQRGERLYRIHCLNCHGATGHGDGPMAEILTTEIPDLTALTRNPDGTFPRNRVMGSIDGRFRVPEHGAQEMPVWGLSFQDRGRDADREHDIQQRLRDLTAYLESIQTDGEAQ